MRSRHFRDSCGRSASRTPGSAAGFPKSQTAGPQRPQKTAETADRRPQRPHLETVCGLFCGLRTKAVTLRRARAEEEGRPAPMDISIEEFEEVLGELGSWTAQSDGGMAAQTDRQTKQQPAGVPGGSQADINIEPEG